MNEVLASSMTAGSGYFAAPVSRITWTTRAVKAFATVAAITESSSVTDRSTIPELPMARTDTPWTNASADRSASRSRSTDASCVRSVAIPATMSATEEALDWLIDFPEIKSRVEAT